MLEDLSVKDFALIESISLEFGKGLNILSGETGAGKSILIGSLTFLLGGKATQDSIRSGAESARVSGTVFLEKDAREARDWLHDKGIVPENDRVLIRRTIRDNGKTGAWIEDVPVSRAELAEFTSFLVDVHGQHDHQSLFKLEEHRRFLDSFAGISDEVAEFTRLYGKLADKRTRFDEMNTSEQERERRREILEFSVDEISRASLQPGEDASLTAEETRLGQHEKLYSVIDSMVEGFYGDQGSMHGLKKLVGNFDVSASIDNTLEQNRARLENAYYEIEDIAESLRQYRDGLVFDPARLESVQERLSMIFKLKKKYGATIEEILDWKKGAELELEQLSGWESNRIEMEKEIAELEREVYRAGSEISAKRKKASSELESGVEKVLRSLGMSGTRFNVALALRPGTDAIQKSGPYGFDTIEFLISANAGESLRPLARIASGGELSRVMLALKTVLTAADETGTLIFDEIDTGIGGEVALAVGAHLKELAQTKQVLCITHLASIAAHADHHIKIEKKTEAERTVTSATGIEGRRRVEEVARMLAGDGYSDASIRHAEELISKFA